MYQCLSVSILKNKRNDLQLLSLFFCWNRLKSLVYIGNGEGVTWCHVICLIWTNVGISSISFFLVQPVAKTWHFFREEILWNCIINTTFSVPLDFSVKWLEHTSSIRLLDRPTGVEEVSLDHTWRGAPENVVELWQTKQLSKWNFRKWWQSSRNSILKVKMALVTKRRF